MSGAKEKVRRGEFRAMENLLSRGTTKHMVTDSDGQRREMTAEEREAEIRKWLEGFEVPD